MTRVLAILCAAALLLGAAAADAADAPRPAKDAGHAIVVRAGKTGSLSHDLAIEFAGALAVAVNGAYTLDVQESQGSVENVIDARRAPRNYLFTAGPNAIAEARRGAKPFGQDWRYDRIRALFPMPAQTVQWVVRKDMNIKTLADLAGRNFISGSKGSVAERVTTEALETLGILREVQIMDIQVGAAAQALKAKQVSGFAIAGPYPVPSLMTLAQGMPIRLLSMPAAQMSKVVRADDSLAPELVPKGTYPGLDEDVTALALPAGVYTTTQTSDDVAYAVAKAFWTERDALAKKSPVWQAVTAAALAQMGAKLHPGALRFYREAGIPVPPALR